MSWHEKGCRGENKSVGYIWKRIKHVSDLQIKIGRTFWFKPVTQITIIPYEINVKPTSDHSLAKSFGFLSLLYPFVRSLCWCVLVWNVFTYFPTSLHRIENSATFITTILYRAQLCYDPLFSQPKYT